ncbi:DNA methyltransferase [Pseudanabaena sp. SR411]|uniref:Eco57I restriction-modification methylase domain-containing protein n=1 Tax=Pseudanabaena sp. SR411 TaxID=1980935 RepID=UPI0020CE69AD|nr:DNA methyltransferase [Pseudanabaena sp. SR411]
MTYLSPTTKSQLSKTIRNLRDRLITDLHNAVESTYLMGVKLEQVQLDEERHCKRERLEKYLEELVKGDLAVYKGKQSPKLKQELRDRHRQDLEKLAAATWLNRLAVIKHLEAMELLKPKLVTGGWQSAAFKEFRDYAPEFLQEEDQGYGLLLRLVFDELALDLSGLFGRGGLNGYIELIPMPALTLRYLVEELDKVEADAWRDDTTLGWIYQYWNDPERESIDQKMNDGGKVEPHEIASKTQMFTERYMVEWLLQNSLNNQWLDICAANGWVAEAVSDRTLENLEARRQDWRQRREAGDVALDELMPIENEQEQRWKYWVRSPLAPLVKGGKDSLEVSLHKEDGRSPLTPLKKGGKDSLPLLPPLQGGLGGIETLQRRQTDLNKPNSLDKASLSLRNLKLIDPACGSGHFLVIAFDLLFAFYQEEARHRGEVLTDAEIANSILENNLYGIDIDARAVQMAAAALWLKAKGLCKDAAPKQINLVAANLNLANLPKDDSELLNFYDEVRLETGIPPKLTMQIVEALKGADVWGSLLKVDGAVTQAIADYEAQVKVLLEPQQGSLFEGFRPAQARLDFDKALAQVTVLEALERFLQQRSQSDDLGVRLWGEQLAAGVRFVRMVREGQYDLVIGNPPYQGTSKMADAGYLSKHYSRGKADLYAAFLQRGLELAKDGGFSALLTMRNWMFISQYSAIREFLIESYDLRLLGDFDRGAFDDVPNEILAVVMSVFQKVPPSDRISFAQQPTTFDDNSYDRQRTNRKRAAVLAHVGRYEFKTQNFNVIKEKPLIYWWDDAFLKRYAETPKLGEVIELWQGVATTNNTRYLRYIWELSADKIWLSRCLSNIRIEPTFDKFWVPYIKGAKGKSWFEPAISVIKWVDKGFEFNFSQEMYRENHQAYQLKDPAHLGK